MASGVAMLRATLAYRAGDLSAAEALGASAVELEDDPTVDVAGRRAGHARRRAPLPRRALGRRPAPARGGGGDRQGRRQQHGGAARAGTLAAVTFAAGDIDAARRWVAAADALRAQQSLEEYWMGSLATAVEGSSPRAPATSSGRAASLERAVVLARRGEARPEQIYALAALAPVQATLGDGDAPRRRSRSARVALRDAPSPGMFVHLLDDAERRLRGKAAVERPAPEVEELSPREMSVLRLLGSELSIAEIGDRALHLAQHGQDARARHLPQARRRDARRRGRAGARAAPASEPSRPPRSTSGPSVHVRSAPSSHSLTGPVQDRRVDRQQAHGHPGEQRDPARAG